MQFRKLSLMIDKRSFLFLLLVFLASITIGSSTAQSGPLAQSYDPPSLVCPVGYSPIFQIPNFDPETIWLSSNPFNAVPGGVTGFDANVNLAANTEVLLTVWTGLGHPELNCPADTNNWICNLPHQPDERYEIWLDGSLVHTTTDWGEHFWAYDANVNLGTLAAGNHSFHLEHADLDMNNPTSSVFFFVGVCGKDAPPPPPPPGQCTYTIGYWKNHAEDWPVNSLTLGTVNYTQAQLLAILNQPVRGNGLISLAHQLIGAKLNVANGTDATGIGAAIANADALIGGLVVPPVGGGSLATNQTSGLVGSLDAYNNGLAGPAHCG